MLINVQSQLLNTVDSIHDIEKELRHVAHAQLTERHGTFSSLFLVYIFILAPICFPYLGNVGFFCRTFSGTWAIFFFFLIRVWCSLS